MKIILNDNDLLDLDLLAMGISSTSNTLERVFIGLNNNKKLGDEGIVSLAK